MVVNWRNTLSGLGLRDCLCNIGIDFHGLSGPVVNIGSFELSDKHMEIKTQTGNCI